jgi:hypothetical protein
MEVLLLTKPVLAEKAASQVVKQSGKLAVNAGLSLWLNDKTLQQCLLVSLITAGHGGPVL